MTCEPIFDLSVPDWEYISFLSCLIKAPHGYIDILGLVYIDEEVIFKMRVKHPSGNRMVGVKKFGKDPTAPKEYLNSFVKDFASDPLYPSSFQDVVEIKNPGKTGQSLFNELITHPSLEVSTTEVSI